jgi:hypothetical protein
MVTDTPEPTPNPNTLGYKTVFVAFDARPVELTPEELARPLYGRPDPRRHLDDDAPPPSPPDAPPPGGTPNPA